MKVEFALAADSASWQYGRRLFLMGGGIDTLEYPSLPIVVPQLAIVLKVMFSASECGQEHTLQIRALNPAGQQFYPPLGVTVVPSLNVDDPEEYTPFEVVFNMRDLYLEKPGRYTFPIDLDRLQMTSITINVREGSAQSTAQTRVIEILGDALMDGYRAFTRGDPVEASNIFKRLSNEFPHSADAYNNLGFLALSRGETDDALGYFQKALDEGFRYPQYVYANIACCRFAKGQHREAKKLFEMLMRMKMPTSHAVLFALGRNSMNAVELESPADYVALMALNAARSAISAHDRDAALLAGIAQAGRITFQQEKGTKFNQALDELMEDVKGRPKQKA